MKLPMLPLQAHPEDVFNGSWMANEDEKRQLHDNVQARLKAARKDNGLPPCDPAYSVDVLVRYIRQGVREKRWIMATTSCALLGELIYASEQGGLYKVPKLLSRKSKQYGRDSLHRPLEILRNACVHPAMVVGKGEDGPAMERLVEAVRRTADGGPLATQLEKQWNRLHERALTAWALARIDYAGRHELGKPEAVPDRY